MHDRRGDSGRAPLPPLTGSPRGFRFWKIFIQEVGSHSRVSHVLRNQMGHIVGNAMAVNVLERLMPRVLFSMGWVEEVIDPWE